MEILRNCDWCKKEYLASNRNSKYCCIDCKNSNRKERSNILSRQRYEKQKRNMKTRNNNMLTEISKKAREAGMSYGQYVAKNFLKG